MYKRQALQRIAALYAIEAMIRGESADVRLKIRTERSGPLFAQLRTWLDATLSRVSAKSEMAKAIRYALARWDALTLVLRDGRVCIDNNAAERSMRPMTLGRKNWLFAGSDSGGERAAAIYTPVSYTHLIQRTLNCSMKTAWFLGHRVRECMKELQPFMPEPMGRRWRNHRGGRNLDRR